MLFASSTILPTGRKSLVLLIDLVFRLLFISWPRKVNEILLSNRNAIRVKAIKAPCCPIRSYVDQNDIPPFLLCLISTADYAAMYTAAKQGFFSFSWNTSDALYANGILHRRYT